MKKTQKVVLALLRLVPVCAAFMLSLNINSTGSWIKGQETPPKSAKKYRKF